MAIHRSSPKYIPGVYNYCDRWCERCRFQTRCRLFRNRRRYEDATARGLPDDPLFKLLDQDDEDEEAGPPLTVSERLDWETCLAEVNRPLTAEEMAVFERREARHRRLIERDPLAVASRECSELARNLLQSLAPVIEGRADPVVKAAVGTISWFADTISIRTRRALDGWLDAKDETDSDDWAEASRSDSDGTAKLLRLIVQESRDAWAVLVQAGLGDGVPAEMVRRLEALDALVAERFPKAMAFVRPGLDEG